MLRQNDLDDERFHDIAERARLSVADYFPAWNDFNTHDPGIMLIELFSWLTEAQRFHMDQSEHAAVFFPLLGITPRRVSAAVTELYPQHDAARPIPAGTPVMAEDIRFELENPFFRCLSKPEPLKAVQRHTVFEDVACEAVPTYLSETGERIFFSETGGVYTRVDSIERGGNFRVISCEREAMRLRVPGTANGFPNQRFAIETRGQKILHDSFTLLIGESVDMARALKWTLADDFSASGPADTHYMLDDENGIITFGDGIRGAMPKGVVFIASMALTRGSDGNIMAGKLTGLVYGGCRLELTQPHHAEGGSERESTAETMARLSAEKRQAVTAEDIEMLAAETPGVEVERVHAFADDGAPAPGQPRIVTVAVKLFGNRAILSDEQCRAVRKHLEPYRLAGFEYRIVSPKYAGIRLNIELCAQRRDAVFLRTLEDTVMDSFSKVFGGFNVKIRRSEIASFLSGVAEVSQITICEATTYSDYARADIRGDICLVRDALAYLEELRLRIIS